MDDEQRFKNALRLAGERVTAPRLGIFRILNRYSPLTMSQLIEKASVDGIDMVTAYRTISLFQKLALAQELGMGRNRLLELSDSFHGHHHHFICVKCGKVTDFDTEVVEAEIRRLGSQLGVAIDSHQLEVSGTCAQCLAAKR